MIYLNSGFKKKKNNNGITFLAVNLFKNRSFLDFSEKKLLSLIIPIWFSLMNLMLRNFVRNLNSFAIRKSSIIWFSMFTGAHTASLKTFENEFLFKLSWNFDKTSSFLVFSLLFNLILRFFGAILIFFGSFFAGDSLIFDSSKEADKSIEAARETFSLILTRFFFESYQQKFVFLRLIK